MLQCQWSCPGSFSRGGEVVEPFLNLLCRASLRQGGSSAFHSQRCATMCQLDRLHRHSHLEATRRLAGPGMTQSPCAPLQACR